MVSVQPSRSAAAVDVIITFRNADASPPIYIAADALNWEPQLMTGTGEAFEHVFTVPQETRTLLYKFRIGDHQWIHDGSASAEADNHGGWNNRFDIPELAYTESAVDASELGDEMTELESVAGIESIADTVSEVTDEDGWGYVDEPDYVDVDDFLTDPDFPAYPEHLTPSSARQPASYGMRSKF